MLSGRPNSANVAMLSSPRETTQQTTGRMRRILSRAAAALIRSVRSSASDRAVAGLNELQLRDIGMARFDTATPERELTTLMLYAAHGMPPRHDPPRYLVR